MNRSDPILIPHPISSFREPLPRLKGGETGRYLRAIGNGLGDMLHECEINGHIYPLKEGEFEVEAAQEFDHC